MTTKTLIGWTEFTWNPLAGCSIYSPGCRGCYAMAQAARLARMGVEYYKGLTKEVNGFPVWTGEVRFVPHKLLEPMKRKTPSLYFVNSMSDLFHEDVPDAVIDQIFAVMALTPWHRYQILTKRTERARVYLASRHTHEQWATPIPRTDPLFVCAVDLSLRSHPKAGDKHPTIEGTKGIPMAHAALKNWPLPNVWLGFSAEDQDRFDARWADFHHVADQGWHTWCSAEPLLGPIQFTWVRIGPDHLTNALSGHHREAGREWMGGRLEWLVDGGESGRKARPAHPGWFRLNLSQCQMSGTPYNHKQDGVWAPDAKGDRYVLPGGGSVDLVQYLEAPHRYTGAVLVKRVAKDRAGRVLDGEVWDQYPEGMRHNNFEVNPCMRENL